MRKKIIGILFCTLLIAIAIPASGIELGKTIPAKQIIIPQQNYKGNRAECGTEWIILMGNESAMIGSKIQLQPGLGICFGKIVFTPFTFGIVISYDVELIQDPENPFNGSYGIQADVCGFYRVFYVAPPDTNCTALYKPYFILREGEIITEYIVLPVEYKP